VFTIIFYSFFTFFLVNKKIRSSIFFPAKKYGNKTINKIVENNILKKLEALMQQ